MIYMQLIDGRRMLIIEPGNIERLQEGRLLTTPDGAVAVGYTPDAAWLSAEIEAATRAGVMDGALLSTLIEDSQKRERVLERPHHPLRQIVDCGNVVPKAS